MKDFIVLTQENTDEFELTDVGDDTVEYQLMEEFDRRDEIDRLLTRYYTSVFGEYRDN